MGICRYWEYSSFWGSQDSKSGRVYLHTRDCESESVIARERFLAQVYNRAQLLDPDDAG